MKRRVAILALLSVLPLASARAAVSVAQEKFLPDSYDSAPKFYAGASLGVGSLSEGAGVNLNYGLNAGYRFGPYWSAGAHFEHVDRGTLTAAETGTGSAADASLNLYEAEGDYFFGFAPGLQLGARAGLGTDRLRVGDRSDTTARLYIGPKLAYDYAIGGGVTVGGEAAVQWGTGSTAKTLTSFLGSLKLWI